MEQPVGFVDNGKPHHVCKLWKAVYGLKQAPRAWYLELRTFLIQSGFVNSLVDASLFVFHSGNTLIYTLFYVDDIIITGNDSAKVQEFIEVLSRRFSLKDLDELSYFLGVEATRSNAGLLLNQRKYITDLLHRTNMSSAKPASSPMVTTERLQLSSGTPLTDGSEYRRVVDSLQYLHFTRPDI
ncbi:Retrovirus-related Pol polyprotein from transposon RE1 [Cardamine amara subsp. amara]|uniref:Retrovirus-related Pol polyprotein from transposon RE1 n=1 Tax=Cardamine amara subsp. amara TaxID=228776 RepID=A0ABD1C592_CARAN